MSRKLVCVGALLASVLASSAMAQSGNISVPGLISASGSNGSTVKNSTINVSGNSAKRVTAGGGSVGIKVAELEMQGVANVNSVNITGSEVSDSVINVTDNTAEDIYAIGGTANVNSVNIN
ncbi:hypothetical protein [Vandammella animalimorsus]|uniref:Uncharacterized protein n=1 Tax=Vandammella animalimorsus TaxID=2029117 RepID=A0A2A2A8Y7_9BURK|nr:hypothetical protein [Vandammella animalimorsus]PAT34263.1 hypothetical protein CK620_08485 [Vandammella animalimorsus]